MKEIQEGVKCFLFLIFTQFYEHIHVGPNLSLRDISNVGKGDSVCSFKQVLCEVPRVKT